VFDLFAKTISVYLEVRQKKLWTQNEDLDQWSMCWLKLQAFLAVCLGNGLRNDHGQH